MVKVFSLFSPQESQPERSRVCFFNLKGCCFDPKKSVDGYLAVPCFGCRDIEDRDVDE
ncbi:hypothetical protein JXA12_05200 [Candidatus Woesearchaeota archaeon]|nr:hypothetical protein [Candidatus Woesearchaeota archaeon]